MVNKIISGGQAGVDRAALDFAIRHGIPHGGSVPEGRLAEDGRISDKYNLYEMVGAGYAERTEQNVLDGDGTLIMSHGELEGGSKHTLELAEKHGKPCLHLDLEKHNIHEAAAIAVEWLEKENIETLNVAGPRASKDDSIYKAVTDVLQKTLL